MRKKFAAILVGIVICISTAAVFLIRSVNHMKWLDYTPSEIRELALGVESFRDENGEYPADLSKIADENGTSSARNIARLLNGVSGNRYGYHSVSNGFVISAAKSSGLFSRSESIETQFETGNLFNDKRQSR